MAAEWAAALAEAGPAGGAPAQQVTTEQVAPASFTNFTPTTGNTAGNDIGMILDIPVQLTVELGRTRIPIKHILQLAQGSVVELDALAGEPMDVLVNGYLIAQGEVVVVNDKFGIRLTDIVTPSERMRLEQLRAVMRQMQTPGPGASNPSRSGVTMASLVQSIIPGAKTAGDMFRDAVLAPRAARAQLEAAPRPGVVGPTLKSAALGAITGPDAFWLNLAAGSANAFAGQEDERRKEELNRLFEELNSYGY